MAKYSPPTYAEILASLIAEGKARLTRITNWVVGGIARSILAVVAYGLAALYAVVDSAVALAFADTSYGYWLDLIAALLGLKRNAARKVAGRVVFSRAGSGSSGSIPSGTIVATTALSDGSVLRYRTTAAVAYPGGPFEVEAPVEAESVGARYNVGAGAISVKVSTLPGVDGVHNADDWIDLEGTDDESDDHLKERLYARWAAFSYGGTRELYLSVALGVNGVGTAAVDAQAPRGDGTIDVIVTGVAGDPSPALITAVQVAVDKVKPLEARVLAKAARDRTIDVSVRLVKSLTGGEPAAIQAAGEDAVEGVFLPSDDARAYQIGEKGTRAKLAGVLIQVPNVANIDVVLPGDDISVDPDEVLKLGTLTVVVVGS